MRLTLRTLLAYLDDTLPGDEAKLIGQKVAESPTAQELVETIKQVTRRRRLSTPPADKGNGSDANTVAEYLSDSLPSEKLEDFETMCLESHVHLAEVAACHQILTLLLSEPVRVPPTARQRMYRLVTGPESLPNKKPGSTVPVGGILPDEPLPHADDSDAAYLLGMKAFGQTESRGQQFAQLLILGGLVAGLGLTAFAAWPRSNPADLPAKRFNGEVAVKVPDDRPKPVENPDPPAPPMPPPIELPQDQPPAAPPPAPVEAKPPVDLVPAAQLPKPDSLPVGEIDGAGQVVLADRGGKWLRVMPAMPGVRTAERLLALPGYKASVKLETGPVVELWGNLPDQVPIPILESSVTFHPPYDGFDADLTLHTGRIYLTTKKPTGSTIRVRCDQEIWDVTLPDDKADVVVEVTHRLVPGLMVDVDPSEKPLATIQLAVLRGAAKLKVRYKIVPDLLANDTVFWSSKGVGFQGPKKLVPNQPFPAASILARTTPAPNEAIAKATLQTLADFAENLREPEACRVRLAELLADAIPALDETRTDLNKRAVRPSIAVLGQAALGDLPALVESLGDETRPRVRDAAVYGLVTLAATSPTALDELAKLFNDKARLTPDQTKSLRRLLHGPTEAERTDPKALDQLIEYLNSPLLPVRELAYWVLVNEVDPEVRSMRNLSSFDVAGPPLARDGFVASWKRRVEDLKKK